MDIGFTSAEKSTGGMVRGQAIGYINVDKSEVLEKVRICTANLESNIVDFLISSEEQSSESVAFAISQSN
jgi:hypothetical protein